MKLFRYGPPGSERPGVLDSFGVRRDLSGVLDDIIGAHLGIESIDRLRQLDVSRFPVVSDAERIGPCLAQVGNFIGVGLSYADHAVEAGFEIPKEPLLFNKAPSCLSGPNDDVPLPRGFTKVDWEVELAVVIGTRATYVSEVEAFAVVAGYCVCNDISERAFQNERGGQFSKGKGCPGFGPLGPWLVTPDEIDDVQNLSLWLSVNGEMMQNSTTKQMLFGIHALVSYISNFMTLEPGDVITTGTPAGVGLARKPPRYLQPGDIVELSVEGLGVQRQRMISPP